MDQIEIRMDNKYEKTVGQKSNKGGLDRNKNGQ